MTDPATSYSIMGTVSGFLGDVQQAKDNRIRELDFRLKNLGPEHVDVQVLTVAWGSYVLPLVNFSKQRNVMVVRWIFF